MPKKSSTVPRVNKPVSFAILGCGARGQAAARWIAAHPPEATLVAVADPLPDRLSLIANNHNVPTENRFDDWKKLLARPRLADAVVLTLMDADHAAAAVPALDLGYDMLLEKPMAVTLEDCIAINDARIRNNSIVSVCHSLRYQITYRRVKAMIEANAIGKVMSIDQLEGVDPVHQAHSFVRGNWGNESRSTFMLLAKSCHDIDILIHLVGSNCTRVSSFGTLSHFTRSQRPAGAPPRCSDGCPHEENCPYSALKIYGQAQGWGKYIGLDRLTQAQRDEFVQTSPYGRCVYDTDNDAVDHQVVNFEFETGATGTFTMTAFAPAGRKLRVHGTHGFIQADIDNRKLEIHRFWGPNAGKETVELPAEDGGHGGGDANMLSNLVQAIRDKNPSVVLTGTEESLRTHAVAFAAEQSRRQRRTVELDELMKSHSALKKHWSPPVPVTVGASSSTARTAPIIREIKGS
jgi:predicted dehydrogenase